VRNNGSIAKLVMRSGIDSDIASIKIEFISSFCFSESRPKFVNPALNLRADPAMSFAAEDGLMLFCTRNSATFCLASAGK
jgi:hypothetical protein